MNQFHTSQTRITNFILDANLTTQSGTYKYEFSKVPGDWEGEVAGEDSQIGETENFGLFSPLQLKKFRKMKKMKRI